MNAVADANKLVIISGRSGSGKSTALHVLEDAGFYCIDNLPAALLPQLATQALSRAEATLARIAVGIDARNLAAEIARFPDILAELPTVMQVEIVFLDANDSTLLKRFSETRRKHPLSSRDTTLHEALAAERLLLAPIAAAATLSIDTSQMSLHELRDLVARSIVAESGSGMLVQFESFGFKRGLPVDADMVFDLRCLPNPHWVEALQSLTGRDAAVIEYLDRSPEVNEMFEDISRYLEKWLPRYVRSNRSYVTIAIGCTGGQHRSVYMCERLLAHFATIYPRIQVRHRELGS
jgi:RNase adapter protein RapZ